MYNQFSVGRLLKSPVPAAGFESQEHLQAAAEPLCNTVITVLHSLCHWFRNVRYHKLLQLCLLHMMMPDTHPFVLSLQSDGILADHTGSNSDYRPLFGACSLETARWKACSSCSEMLANMQQTCRVTTATCNTLRTDCRKPSPRHAFMLSNVSLCKPYHMLHQHTTKYQTQAS